MSCIVGADRDHLGRTEHRGRVTQVPDRLELRAVCDRVVDDGANVGEALVTAFDQFLQVPGCLIHHLVQEESPVTDDGG